MSNPISVSAEPDTFSFDKETTAIILIDMQRDFMEPAGFGESLGNDVSQLRKSIEPNQKLLSAARALNIKIIHTREGHRPDLNDVHPEKQARCASGKKIGDVGPMGRILVRGEAGHDFIPELYPLEGESIIDKPGKGAFYSTDLDLMLRKSGIDTLIICGVTTEVCVHTTVREANDRGYKVLVPDECCASYFEEFHTTGLKMISAQGGIFGYVCKANDLIDSLKEY